MANTYKRLAAGQLASSSGDLYTVPTDTKALSPLIRLYNTGGTTEVIKLHLRDGSTSRQFAQIELVAGAWAEVAFEKTVLEDGDKIQGQTTTATTVNYWLSGVEVT